MAFGTNPKQDQLLQVLTRPATLHCFTLIPTVASVLKAAEALLGERKPSRVGLGKSFSSLLMWLDHKQSKRLMRHILRHACFQR